MNMKQVQKFVLTYLEATGCHIIEKSPNHITVKLSPAADRALTGRPFYWSFIDSTGTEPETLTYTWIFQRPEVPEAGVQATRLTSLLTPAGRVLREEIFFGSRRLNQIFDAVRQAGRHVTLFAEPPRAQRGALGSLPYSAWLGVNFKVGYECDVKKEELYGWGISLATGVIDENFWERVSQIRLTPRLPASVHLLPSTLSLKKGMAQLEQALEKKLKTQDFAWAEEAEKRRKEEQERLRHYYEPLLKKAQGNPEQESALQANWLKRAEEIDWQYRPRITVRVVNCGVFHLPGID